MNLVCLFIYYFFFAFYAEIQDGRQKWWENDFCEMSPVDFANLADPAETLLPYTNKRQLRNA